MNSRNESWMGGVVHAFSGARNLKWHGLKQGKLLLRHALMNQVEPVVLGWSPVKELPSVPPLHTYNCTMYLENSSVGGEMLNSI